MCVYVSICVTIKLKPINKKPKVCQSIMYEFLYIFSQQWFITGK